MRKIILLAALGVLVSATSASAQATIAGGKHDLSAGSALRNSDAAINGQTCVFCHTPHGGATTLPLWNRSAPTGAGYQLYTSSTMDAASPGGPAVGGGMSGACLSCHDGSIAVDVLLNLGGVAKAANTTFVRQLTAEATFGTGGTGAFNIMTGGMPFMGTDLRNDHPITIIYETARAVTPGDFITQAITGSKVTVGASLPLPLFGTATATATVECASCHNPHNNSNAPFLRKSNIGSAICLSCHIK